MDQLHEYNIFHDKGIGTTPGEEFKKIRVHFVYACKHDDRHKARLCVNRNLTEIPINSVYSGVISLKSLRTVILLAELNGLETWATDIGNAYLEAETSEKAFIIAGPKFGELEGDNLVVFKARSSRCVYETWDSLHLLLIHAFGCAESTITTNISLST
jgi:hypothetical protein